MYYYTYNTENPGFIYRTRLWRELCSFRQKTFVTNLKNEKKGYFKHKKALFYNLVGFLQRAFATLVYKQNRVFATENFVINTKSIYKI